MIEFIFSDSSNSLTCRLSGRMDAPNSISIEGQIMAKIAEYKKGAGTIAAISNPLKVVFDLGAVDFVASAFLRVCMNTMKSVSQGAFSVQNTSPEIKKIFKISGLDALLKVS